MTWFSTPVDVLDDAFAVSGPDVDAEAEVYPRLHLLGRAHGEAISPLVTRGGSRTGVAVQASPAFSTAITAPPRFGDPRQRTLLFRLTCPRSWLRPSDPRHGLPKYDMRRGHPDHQDRVEHAH